MFGLYTYQLYEIERPKTVAEVRAADVRRGEFAAALSRSLRAIASHTRSLASAGRTAPGAPSAALARCPDAVPLELLATASAPASRSSDWQELSSTDASPARVG